MKKIFRRLSQSELLRNTSKLLSANLFAQGLGIVIYPILTRMYSPEDFGLANLFISIASIVALVATAEYQYAIPLPKSRNSAVRLCQLSLLILITVTAISGVSVCWAEPIAALFGAKELANWYGLLPIFIFALGGWNILNYWYIRNKAFARISGYQMGLSLFTNGAKIGLGFGGFGAMGLIVSAVFAPVCSLLLSVALAWKKYLAILLPKASTERSATPIATEKEQGAKTEEAKDVTIKEAKDIIIEEAVEGEESEEMPTLGEVGKQYRNFPLLSLPRALVNTFAGQMPVLLLTPFFGSEGVGLWGMALLLGFTPLNMLSKTIYQVLFQHISVAVQERRAIGGLLNRFVGGAIGIGLPCFAILFFFLPTICAWLLGGEWETTGRFLQWMLPWLGISFITASTCFLSDIFFEQKKALYFEVAIAIVRLAGIGIGIYCQSMEIAVAGYAIGSFLAIGAQQIWLLSLARKYDKSLE